MRQPTIYSTGATADAVFVDRTGRRRLVFTILGLGLGAVLLAAVALLVAGLTGTGPVTLPGLPEREHAVKRGEVGPVGWSPTASAAPSRSAGSATSPPDRPAVTANPSSPGPAATATSSSPAAKHGNRPSTHPGNPKPTRTK